METEAAIIVKQDPFNYPSLNRADLMSLNVLHGARDGVNTRTENFRPRTRQQSSNLQTTDIQGKFSNNLKPVGAKPRVWAKPEVNKPYF